MSEVTLITYGGGDDFGEFIVLYQDGRRRQVCLTFWRDEIVFIHFIDRSISRRRNFLRTNNLAPFGVKVFKSIASRLAKVYGLVGIFSRLWTIADVYYASFVF